MKKLFVIKIGGNIIDDEKRLNSFLADFSKIKDAKILIHGGGKIATELSAKLGVETKMVDGRRITDAETLKVVTMVYAGLINKNIVAKLQSQNCSAVGLTGADANLIPATKRKDKSIDYGFVGDVDSSLLAAGSWQLFIDNNFTPVIAPITHDGQGNLLNTNADTIASSIAVGLSGMYDVTLLYCFEKNGVLKDPEDNNSWINEISLEQYDVLKKEGAITKGMIPKLDNAFEAMAKGVRSVFICHADNLKNIIYKKETIGTELTA